jgi:hypothetical protein
MIAERLQSILVELGADNEEDKDEKDASYFSRERGIDRRNRFCFRTVARECSQRSGGFAIGPLCCAERPGGKIRTDESR